MDQGRDGEDGELGSLVLRRNADGCELLDAKTPDCPMQAFDPSAGGARVRACTCAVGSCNESGRRVVAECRWCDRRRDTYAIGRWLEDWWGKSKRAAAVTRSV